MTSSFQSKRSSRTGLAGLAILAILAILATLVAGTTDAVAADAYPTQAIRLIVPTAPGGNVDMTARLVSVAMGKILKTSIVVENMPGAANAIGEAYVVRAKPDGYTLLFGNDFAVVMTPALVPSSNVRLEDFAPVGLVTVTPGLLEVKAGNKKGIRTFADFIAYAKAHPGELSVGNAGLGSINHAAELMIEHAFDIKLTIIPFKGAAPGIPAVIGEQIDGQIDQISSSSAMIKSGQLLPLAVTTARRIPEQPNVPTVAEIARSDYELQVGTLMAAPKGTPPAVLQTLNDALQKALADPDVLQSIKQAGATPMHTSLDATGKSLAALKARMQPLVDSGAIAPQKPE